MKKQLIFILALLLVLASCTTDTVAPSREKSFLGGTIGLLVNFVESEPPAEVTDNGEMPFTVSVKLENKGEAAIPADKVLLTLRGINGPTFNVQSSELVDRSLGEEILKNDINPDTGEAIPSPAAYFTFPELNFIGVLSGNQPFPFVVDVCYNYHTLVSAPLCIKENLLDSSTEICTVTGPKEVQNSGGPVQVTYFEEFSAGKNAISFSFKVKNVGNGLLSRSDSVCDSSTTNKNYVKVSVHTGIDGLSCSGFGGDVANAEVKLSTGERVIRCTQQLAESQMSDKIMIVDIRIDYDYEESTSTSVLVKHISTD